MWVYFGTGDLQVLEMYGCTLVQVTLQVHEMYFGTGDLQVDEMCGHTLVQVTS